jgi:hypothetical protein
MPDQPAAQPRGTGTHSLLAPALALAWDKERPRPIDIVAPDQHCTALLVKEAAPLFPAAVVYESSWIVRLEPPTGREWALELLSIVERWLEVCRLPCAKVLYDGRAYLIRASTDGAWFKGAAESAHELPELSVQG